MVRPRLPVTVRQLGVQPYEPVWRAMQRFTSERDADAIDELWLVEHEPVFTLGQAGRLEHLIQPLDIPVVHSDRGGQVTYHGPGQLVAYPLLDLRRARVGIRTVVNRLEQCVIDLLAGADIRAARRPGAPGVYVRGAKIAALGLRVRSGHCYHGIAVNVNMDLEPFQRIDPCGYPGLPVTQASDLGIDWTLDELAARFVEAYSKAFHCIVEPASEDSPELLAGWGQ